MSAAPAKRGRAGPRDSGPAFPCARCGRPVHRSARERPRKIGCARCGYLIYDYPRTCAGVVVLKDDTVLLLRRAHLPRRGRLDVPGGFMEAGESIERAARRELREETGLTLGRIELIGNYWDRYFLRGFGWFPTMNSYFLGRWRAGAPRAADDAASAEWIQLQRLGVRDARYAWKHMSALFRDVKRKVGGSGQHGESDSPLSARPSGGARVFRPGRFVSRSRSPEVPDACR